MAEKEPKYQQVVDWVKDNIASGNFKYGDRMMSEKELSDKFGLSRQTIRHATGELVNQHLLTRVQGSGTYVGSSYMPVREQKYMSVAVVSTFYESYIFPPTLKGIESVLSENGYTMQVSFTDNRISKEREVLENILQKDSVDGLIIEPAKSALPNPNLDLYEEIRNRHIPMIFFNASYRDVKAPCVRIDDEAVARKATEYLIHRGHRDIGAVFKADDGQGHLRYKGYIEALMTAGLSVGQQRVVWIDTPEAQHLGEIAPYIFKRLKGATAVLGYNDEVSGQLITAAFDEGIRVPEDLSVISIDDANVAGIGRVKLTTIPHPKKELGRKVAQNLLRMIGNPEFDGNYLFEEEIVERESVRSLL